jgi:hypothetical protein
LKITRYAFGPSISGAWRLAVEHPNDGHMEY